ncbi:MAG TPA: NAD(P)/FAD-dependent oxidoreductase [Acidimicrobiales bacterium]
MAVPQETVDVLVVGARCAGSAAAVSFARAGRSVLAVDAARFPSSTISTHLLWAGGVAELERLGARARVEASGAPRLPIGYAGIPGAPPVRATYTPVAGIDYGLCVRRKALDAALVATARAAGAEVREQTRVTELIRRGDRVVGVVARPRRGRPYAVRARLVVGADGRRSTVAQLVGAAEPHTSNPNERACYYAYFTDPHRDWRAIAAQWRQDAELGTAFPCDGGLTLVLLMPPLARAPWFDTDREGEYHRTIAAIPGLAARLEGCTRVGRILGATDLSSYFRPSSGPGWALVGDAGHFKDPITAQGIRDALRFGRLLAEHTASSLDDPERLDAALTAWERRRDDECRETYEWTNWVARAEPVGPADVALYRHFADPAHSHQLLDLHSRILSPSQVLATLPHG